MKRRRGVKIAVSGLRVLEVTAKMRTRSMTTVIEQRKLPQTHRLRFRSKEETYGSFVGIIDKSNEKDIKEEGNGNVGLWWRL